MTDDMNRTNSLILTGRVAFQDGDVNDYESPNSGGEDSSQSDYEKPNDDLDGADAEHYELPPSEPAEDLAQKLRSAVHLGDTEYIGNI